MKILNLLLLSVICNFLLACDDLGVVRNQGGDQYTPCSITLNPAVTSASNTPDPLLAYQWYLDKGYVKEAWVTYEAAYDALPESEKKVLQIVVVDDGLQVDHEDLEGNIISGASINLLVGESSPNRNYPYPIDCAEDGHGTAVAGIIAAQGDNGRGVKGVASHGNNIKIWGANLVASSQVSGSMISAVFEHRLPLTAVSSNSWGPSQPTHLSRTGSSFNMLINTGLSTGFGGKGISYVFAAGNERVSPYPERYPLSDRASYSEILNQPGIIPVCAVGFDDKFAPYSEPGPNIWICGYSATNAKSVDSLGDFVMPYANNINPKYLKQRGLATTDLSGTDGYNAGDDTVLTFNGVGTEKCTKDVSLNRGAFDFDSDMLTYEGTCDYPEEELVWANTATTSYTRYFTGTSAATPMISGVIGLIRSAYPNLTWRDIKLILAESAWQPINATALPLGLKDSYALKGAPAYGNDNHNYSHSPDYGFGIVNASAAMNLAAIWEDNRTILSGPQTVYPVPDPSFFSSATPIIIPPNSGISFIEYVQVDIGKSELDFGTLTITLTSPSGAVSVFAVSHVCIDIEPGDDTGKVSENCNDLENGFTFGSAVHLGESPAGDWRLSVASASDAHPVNWKLRLYGH